MTKNVNIVTFTSKGQVVVPARLRKEFHIEAGSRAVVQATPEGILLKPMTRHTIAKLHGILKPRAGHKPLAEEWAEHRREEKSLEDRRVARHRS